MSSHGGRILGAAGMGLLLLALWQWGSVVFPKVLLPSPGQTLMALGQLMRSGELSEAALSTVARAAGAAAMAIGLGAFAGWAASRSAIVSGAVAVLRGLGTGIPPVVAAVIAMLWWGTSGQVAILVAALVLFPLVASAAETAFVRASPDLQAMGRAFGLPAFSVFWRITIRLVAPEVIAVGRVVVASALRVVLMVEVIAVGTGIGARISYARSLLLTDEVLAWALLAVVFALTADWLLGTGMTRRKSAKAQEAV